MAKINSDSFKRLNTFPNVKKKTFFFPSRPDLGLIRVVFPDHSLLTGIDRGIDRCSSHKFILIDPLDSWTVCIKTYFWHTMLNIFLKIEKRSVLTLKTPITTKVVCFCRLLKCFRSLSNKQCRPRSGCI